ncbi:MAG: LamG-like jellyroll fold domain-containing protein [Balneolaceae bacterium]
MLKKLKQFTASYIFLFLIIAAQTGYAQDMVLQLDFEEDITDLSEFDNSIEINGEPEFDDDAVVGSSSLRFDGTDDYLEIPGTNLALNEFTLDFFIKADEGSIGGGTVIINKWADANPTNEDGEWFWRGNYEVRFHNPAGSFASASWDRSIGEEGGRVYMTPQNASGTYLLESEEWYNIIYVGNADTTFIQIRDEEGYLLAEDGRTGLDEYATDDEQPLRIGWAHHINMGTASPWLYSGLMDDLQIFDYARIDENGNYNGPRGDFPELEPEPPAEPQKVLHLTFEDEDVSDFSELANSVTSNGDQEFSDDAIVGSSSLIFDGVDDYLEIPGGNLALPEFSVDFFFKADTGNISQGTVILNKWGEEDPNSAEQYFWRTNYEVRFQGAGNMGGASWDYGQGNRVLLVADSIENGNDYVLQDGAWYNAVYVGNADTTFFQVRDTEGNILAESGRTPLGAYPADDDDNLALRVGWAHNVDMGTASPWLFSGLMDDVQIFNYARLDDDGNYILPREEETTEPPADPEKVLHLTFEEDAVSDSSTFVNSVTASGNPEFSEDAVVGSGSLRFDGEDDFLEIPGTNLASQAFSVDFFFKANPDNIGPGTVILTKWGEEDPNASNQFFWRTNYELRFHSPEGVMAATSWDYGTGNRPYLIAAADTGNFNLNGDEWYNAVYVGDADTAFFQLKNTDGDILAQAGRKPEGEYPADNDEDLVLRIGWAHNENMGMASPWLFSGLMDDLHIYNYARIDEDGNYINPRTETVSSETEPTQPGKISLSQNYPNPFNPNTNIEFNLPATGPVKLTVYDVIGKEVAVLLNENRNSGKHLVTFNAEQIPSGIYYYRLETEAGNIVKAMILIK